jgi:hypothetical protein
MVAINCTNSDQRSGHAGKKTLLFYRTEFQLWILNCNFVLLHRQSGTLVYCVSDSEILYMKINIRPMLVVLVHGHFHPCMRLQNVLYWARSATHANVNNLCIEILKSWTIFWSRINWNITSPRTSIRQWDTPTALEFVSDQSRPPNVCCRHPDQSSLPTAAAAINSSLSATFTAPRWLRYLAHRLLTYFRKWAETHQR